MTDIYKPPDSDVTARSNRSPGDISVFERFSTWYVLALSIITLNLYSVYWLYTRTKKLNEIIDLKISKLFCQFTLILYCLSYAIYGFNYVAESSNTYLLLGSAVIDMIANILYLVWVYKFRNRLKESFANEDVHIGAIAPFFFLHLFLQFKLNELIDKNQHNKRMQTEKPLVAQTISQ